jgi:predicted alpha-1,2-mannosidase
MKKWLIILLVLNIACKKADLTQYVDPNIGGVAPLLTTKNPTVHRPHSMIRVFTVTRPGLGDRYLSDKIYGFAVNMPAYRNGHVTELMPLPGDIGICKTENASSYDHDHEEVHPWYHKIWLEDHEVLADWTTTERAVIYRFQFPPEKTGNIIFRAGRNAAFRIQDSKSISGWEEFRGSRQYFYAEFSAPINRYGVFTEESILKDSLEITGDGTGAWASFVKMKDPIEVRVGISFIDAVQARENLIHETDGKTFEQVTAESHRIWKDALNSIRVSGGTERQMRIFYTSLYRAYERMVDISEYGRYYSGYDKQVHPDGDRPFYVDDWLWDTFRSQHPLLTILDPGRQSEMVQSYVDMFEQSGWMPGFPQFFGDFPAMIGFHSAALVWDSYQKGITQFDVEKAYEGLKKNAMEATMLPWRSGPMCSLDSFYREHGWYPALPENGVETVPMVHGFEKRQSVALTLEHSYDDWCLAQLARALGKQKDYEYFMVRSRNYRNVYHTETGFMSPRMADGSWVEPFDPTLSGGVGARMYFAENNAWIWTFSVQHDIPGLINLMEGNDAFTGRLDALFNEPSGVAKWQFMGQFPDASGLNGMFPAGNEPAFHVPYLYNYAGKPWKTQRRIREIMDMWFDDSPLGLPGDEDGGALCSWYVLSAMGFYPVTPGTGLYAIGSPFFENIQILLPDGNTFTVRARNCSKQNKYIQSASLNGEAFDRSWIRHTEITSGGTLELEMGDRPNKDWASDPSTYMKLLQLNKID